MPVTPTGIYSLPLEHLKNMLADSATFQSWVSAANATEAKDNIHLVGIDDENANSPYATIDHGDSWNIEKIAGGMGNHYIDSGTLRLYMESDIPASLKSTIGDAKIDFTNNIGAIVDEMLKLAGSDTYLNIQRIDVIEQPARTTEDTEVAQSDYYNINLMIHWSAY